VPTKEVMMNSYREKLKTKDRSSWTLYDHLYFIFGYLPRWEHIDGVLHVYDTELHHEPSFYITEFGLKGVVFHSRE
jgi:hypothetical protein